MKRQHGAPNPWEREVPEVLLGDDHHLARNRQVILFDRCFTGRDFELFITEDLGAHLLRHDRNDEKPMFGKFGAPNRWIESAFDSLKDQFGLEHHCARTLDRLYARVVSKLSALAAGICDYWKTREPRKLFLTAYDH